MAGALARWGARLGVVVAALVAALVVLEIVLRLLPAPASFHSAVHAFGQAVLEPDPALGHRIRPSASVTAAGVLYRFSPLGTRVSETDGADHTDGAPPEHRILLLGDSVTMGWGLPAEQTYGARLETLLTERTGRRWQVVNAGVVAYGTHEEAILLDELGPKVTPDIVLVGYFPNDPEPQESATRLPGPSWSRLWRVVGPRLLAVLSRWGLRDTATEHHARLHEPSSDTWLRARDALARIGDWCRNHDAACTLALLPELTSSPYPLAAVHERVAAAAREGGFRVLDLAPVLGGRDPRTLWVAPDDAHPNAEGHRLYAEALADWLLNEGLVREEP